MFIFFDLWAKLEEKEKLIFHKMYLKNNLKFKFKFLKINDASDSIAELFPAAN
jgi:hypothetical protein